MLSTALLTLSALPLTFAHFNLNFPPTRGFDDDKQGTFPCGSFDSVSSSRTNFRIGGAPIQLVLGHPQTDVAVYMAIGDDPGSAFSVKIQPTTMITGLGDFCFGNVAIPSNLNVSDGTAATIQVVTNNHESGGLYSCADVTLVNTPLSSSDFSNNCKNGSTTVSQQNIAGNPNETTTAETSGSASGSASAAAPSATASTGAASQAKAVSWVIGAVGLAGMAML
ncbi:hypothetical protein NX059_008452 [Plenodomus lindquistii]|nr:hypothetical protein NX059_008452 [Plenodomus lindquistii]